METGSRAELLTHTHTHSSAVSSSSGFLKDIKEMDNPWLHIVVY